MSRRRAPLRANAEVDSAADPAPRGRRAARRKAKQQAHPSLAEVAIYGFLAAAVALVVLFVGDAPLRYLVAVFVGAPFLVGVLALATYIDTQPRSNRDKSPRRRRS